MAKQSVSSDNPAAAVNNLHHTASGYRSAEEEFMDWTIQDVCKHGNYPGETDCGCTTALPDRVVLMRKEQEATDVS